MDLIWMGTEIALLGYYENNCRSSYFGFYSRMSLVVIHHASLRAGHDGRNVSGIYVG